MFDAKSSLKIAPSLAPAARTSSDDGAIVDLNQFVGVIAAFQHIGAVSGTNPVCASKLQHSDDGETFADSGFVFTNVTASDNQQTLAIDRRKIKRYVMVVWTITGTSPSFTGAATIIGMKNPA